MSKPTHRKLDLSNRLTNGLVYSSAPHETWGLKLDSVRALKVFFTTNEADDKNSQEKYQKLHVRTIFFDEIHAGFRGINSAEFEAYCKSTTLTEHQMQLLRHGSARLVFDEHLIATDSTLREGNLKNIVTMSKLGNVL